MGVFSRIFGAADPTEKCKNDCARRFQQRNSDLQKTRDSLRYAQTKGILAQDSSKVQAAIDRFGSENEAMVRARAAQAVYDPTAGGECTTNLSADRTKLNQELGLEPGTLTSKDFVDEKSGFRAALYRSESNGRYILAYAGTDPHSLSDWDANIDNGRGNDTTQYIEARKLAKKLQANGIDFDITGHSKGGGLATDAGLVASDSQVWTFNSSGLPVDSPDRPEATSATLASLAQRTQAFHTDGDFLTALQSEKDPQKQIENAKSLKAMLKGDTALGQLEISQMNPAKTDKDQLTDAKSVFFNKVDDLIKQAESDQQDGNKFDLFPSAVGQSHVLGAGFKPAGLTKSLQPLIRHLMSGKLGTKGVMDDMESEKDADQKTMSRFRSGVASYPQPN